jgi:hypothetical protein
MSRRKSRSRDAVPLYGPEITWDFLQQRAAFHARANYPKAKWIQFCEAMIKAGYRVEMYEARKTVSKYITVFNGSRRFKLRFSNHGAMHQGPLEDCDYFVGRNSFGTTTTEMAIDATIKELGPSLTMRRPTEASSNASTPGQVDSHTSQHVGPPSSP